ncbi:MAG: thioredoxin family protein [Candidatus Kapaibacteriota bacterium]
MNIKVLGTGCSKCISLERKLNELVKEHNLDVEIEKVSQLEEIMKYGIMMTPGLVINEKVVSFGSVPKDKQILKRIEEAK